MPSTMMNPDPDPVDDVVSIKATSEEEPLVGPGDIIVVDQAEFEKDYEVR